MKSLGKKLKIFGRKWWPYLIIFSLWLIIVIVNYPGRNTWILGYDSMNPELNLSVNLERDFFSAWQSGRGLGLAGSVIDAAELSRLPVVFLIKLVFGENQVRFVWTTLMILAGALGTVALLKSWLRRAFATKSTEQNKLNVAALVGALFYLLGPAMVQFFYVPLEAFSGFYGMTVWLIWAFGNFLYTGRKKDLLILIIMAWCANSAYYVQTFFVVTMLVLGVIGLANLCQKRWKQALGRLVLGMFTIIVINGFWLFPMAYNTINNDSVFLSKQNEISTLEVQLMNQKYGNVGDIAKLHGYWFNYLDYNNETGDYDYYFTPWKQYLESLPLQAIGYLLFGVAVLGIIVSFKTSKRKNVILAGITVFLLAILMLTAGEGPLGAPFRVAAQNNFFNQIFRVAFTKWSVMASLFYALGISLAVFNLSLVKDNKIGGKGWKIVAIAVSAMIVARGGLLFTGHLFGRQSKVEMPSEYLLLFDYMNTQPHEELVVYLPSPNFWGWLHYDWGYRGSGFVWQGVPQATLDRNFDVWSLYNETFYNELALAVSQKDEELLRNLINKYQTRYFVIDEHIIQPQGDKSNLLVDETVTILQNIGAKLIWEEGKIKVFDMGEFDKRGRLSAVSDYASTNTTLEQVRKDVIFAKHGNYIYEEKTSKKEYVNYPFANLWQEKLDQISWIENEALVINGAVPNNEDFTPAKLELPVYQDGDPMMVSGRLSFDGEKVTMVFYPQWSLVVDGVTYPLPTLPDLVIEDWQRGEGSVVVDIQGEAFLVAQNSETFFAAEFRVGQPPQIGVIASESARLVDEKELEVEITDVTNYEVDENFWQTFFEPQEIVVSQNSNVQILISSLETVLDLEGNVGYNCDPKLRGETGREMADDGIYYYANNFGDYCETFPLDNLGIGNDYLIWFNGFNRSGSGLKFYVLSDAYVALEHTLAGDRTHQFFSLIGRETERDYFSFHLDNKSYGDETINFLHQVSFIALPLDYVSKIKLVSGEEASQVAINELVEFVNYDNFGNYAFSAQLEKVPNDALLVLQYGYDESWGAWAKTDAGWQKLEQVKYNSWANAWRLNDLNGDIEVKVVYWPQYLMYVGIGLAGIYGLVLFILTYRGRNKQKVTNQMYTLSNKRQRTKK